MPIFSKISAILKKTGFLESQIKIIVFLLKNPHSTAYEIAKKTGIPSSNTYPILKKLYDQELVQKDEENKYHIDNPKIIFNSYFDKKIFTLIEMKTELHSVLKSVHLPPLQKTITIGEGKKNREVTYLKYLQDAKKSSYSVVGSLPSISHEIAHIIKRKLKQGVEIKGIIMQNTQSDEVIKAWIKKFPKQYRISTTFKETRYALIDTEIVLLWLPKEKNSFTNIIIHNQELAKHLEKSFSQLWKKSK